MQHRFARLKPATARAFALALAGALVAGGALAQQAPAKTRVEKGPTTIDAKSIEGVSDLEVSAQGSVELRRDDTTIFSERLRYNQEFGRVEADGGVRLELGSDRFFGPRLRYDTTNDTGTFEQPTYRLNRSQTAHGKAERIEFLGKNKFRLRDSSFTTCTPGQEDWELRASELELDYDTERGRGKNLKLRLLGTTVAALPFASFPLEKRRKTGFLMPGYSHTTLRGIEVRAPFYWNIAPEMDMTITPVLMSKRGLQVRGDYRYIGREYFGQTRLEYMPEDQELRRARSGFSLLHVHQFTPALQGVLSYNRVSDARYFVDLSSHVQQVSAGVLPREGVLNYGRSFGRVNLGLSARVQQFQTLQDPKSPIVPPYHRVPQIDVGVSRYDIGERFDFEMTGQYARFTHPTVVEGSRVLINPTLTAPLLAPGWFLKPKVGLRYVGYRLTNTAAGQDTSPNAITPWMSLDAGLVYERPVGWFGQSLTQTLEPRLYYVRIPSRDQSQMPIFDTGLAEFNFAQIFTENRFAGGDRFGDANDLTAAVTTRVLAADGQEAVRATLAQRFYFDDERVALNATTPLRTYRHSDLLASVGGRFARHWSGEAAIQHNWRTRQVQRYSVGVRYAPEIAKVINASYRFNRNVLRQVDISGQWPLRAGWYGVGRFNYSLLDGRLLEGLGGIEYNGGCWVFRAMFQRLQAATGITSTGFFVQLELNGLGQIGTDEILTRLRRSVPGYAVTNPRDSSLIPESLRSRLPFEQVF